MKDLFILRGLPGSGKSTTADTMVEMINTYGGKAIKVEADQFFVSNNGVTEKYNFDRRFLGAAHDECYGRTMRYLVQGYTVVVANTFSTKREVNRYLEGLKRTGLDKQIKVQIVKCTGRYKNVHDVPDRAIKRMQDRWEDIEGETFYSA